MSSELKLGAGQILSLGNLEHSMNMLATQGISGVHYGYLRGVEVRQWRVLYIRR